MNNIWLATDWHLWNTEYDDGRHKFKSITRLGQLADGYASVIRNTDLFIHLGDLCDPSNTNPEKLKSIIQSIPGTKVLCRGNHDTESDAYYLAAGFDYVCDILRIHDVIFSHIPVNVGVDQINIHGHLHTRKLSTLDHRYVNAYECNYLDRPILLEDLLQKAITQPSSDWQDTKLNHVEEKMEEYINIDHEVKDNILDLSYEFDLEQQIVQEAIGAAIMTAATIASGANSVNKTIGDWYKQNPITEYVIYNGSESKMHKCIDDTYRFKKTASIAEEMVDKCFIYLRTSNNLDKTQMKRYNIAKTYWKEVKNAHKETQNETSIAPILHSLSATEIEDEDPLDEVIFEDPEDTIYWEQDDTDPKLYKEKEPMAEATSNNVLYHGSKNDMSIITPKNLSQNEDNYVFATPDYSFALCFAANRWDDSIINQSKYNGQLYLTELKPGAMEETFDTDGYMYEVPANKFTKYHNKSFEFISTKSIKPLSKTYIPNILDELNKNGVTISYYPDKPHWWRKTFNEAAFTRYKDDYKPKNKKSINDLKLVKIDKAFIQKYKWVGESLKRNEIYLDRDVAYAWLTKNDKIVARLYITNEDYGDGYKWIALIEIENGYRGNGYGEQVLEFAITHEHGDALGVHKNNTVAINMYKKHGFKISPESQAEVDSGRTNYYQMYRGKGNKNINEAVGAAIMTGMTIASGASNVNSYFNNWYKQNEITDYVIFGTSEQKMYKCIDKTFKFKSTAERAADQVDRTFIYLRTSNNLNKKQKERYDTAKKYWSKVKSEHKKSVKNESIEINEEAKNIKIFDSKPVTVNMIKQYGNEYDMFNHILPDDGQRYTKKNNKKRVATIAWFDGNMPVAIISVLYDGIWRKDHQDGTNRIQGLEVNPDYRNRGIGNQVLNYALNDLHANDIPTSLRVATDNDIAIALYNKNNFETIADKTKDGYNYMLLEHGLNEAATFRQVKRIVDNIPQEEHHYFYHGNQFKDSPYVKYRNARYITKNGKKYGAFIDVYSFDSEPEIGIIVLACEPEARGYGLTDKLIKDAKDNMTKCGYTSLFARIDTDNIHSQKVAERNGFVEISRNDEQIKYEYRPMANIHEVTLTADHLAELHKAHPELSTILPDDGKLITDPTKYYCSKCWMDNDNIVAIASIRYPQANSVHYSEIDNLSITEGYEYLQPDIMNRINELYDFRITESAMLYTNDRVDIYDYKYEVLEEATKGADELYPVYVFLVNSGSAMAKLIGAATGDEYTHASISFDPTMRVMYSFGMKQENGKGFGFAVESINNSWYRGKDMLYSIYCVFVNQSQLKKMKDRVQYFVKYGTNFLFDFPGLFLNAMNISANPQHRWFCSRFVADVLNAGSSSKKNQYIKDASYMRPNDFTQTNFAHYICGGKIKNFRASTVKAQTLKAMEKEKNDRMLRGKKQMHYTVQRFQEAAAQLSPASNADMNKLNNKWGLKAIGVNDRDAYIAEEEEKLNKIREHDRKIKEMKQKNKQKLKAAKNEKKMRKLRVKNEEVHDPFNITDQDRFFDWNNYENTVLGENYHILALKDKSFRFMFSMNEVSKHSSNKLVPVYIILTYTGSLVSRAVKLFTGDEYTHASIAFDSSLTEMYTFGRARDESITDGMFKIEDVTSPYYTERVNPIPYAIYCVPVTIEERDKMIKKVNYFAQNKNKFQFDFAGLILNGLHIPNNPKNRYFCSRFVSEILNAGDPDNPLVAEPSLQHPQTFAEDDYAKFVCSGDNLAGYDKSVVDKVTRDIIRTEKIARRRNKVKNEGYIGVNPYDPFTSNVLHYKLAMLDESEVDNFMDYLTSFKIQYDHDGNVIISRKEIDQLYKYFNESNRLCKSYSESGNIEGLKEELAKMYYMVKLINTYYLSPNASKNNRIKSDIKQEFLDLRGLMLTTFNVYIRYIKIKETNFNFQEYYDTSKYSKENNKPAEILTQVNKVLVVDL